MARFFYKAVGLDGRVVSGELDALTQRDATDRLLTLGQTPLSVGEARKSLSALLQTDIGGRGDRLRRRELLDFLRDLATLLQKGLQLDRALSILAEATASPPVRRMSARLLDRLRGGAAFSEAIAAEPATFPPLVVSMVRVGEASGAQDTTLGRLAENMARAADLRESVRSALIYPLVLAIVSVACVVLLLTLVLPQFQGMIEEAGQTLPLSTRMLLALAAGLQAYWWAGALALLVLILAVRRLLALPEVRLRVDRALLRLPGLGPLLAKLEMARSGAAWATMLGNGVPMLDALAILREATPNQAFAQVYGLIAAELREGKSPAMPMRAAGIFPEIALQLIRVGEETGQLEDMLRKAAEICEAESRRIIARAMVLLTPAVTVVMGLIVSGIILSILSAMLAAYDLPF